MYILILVLGGIEEKRLVEVLLADVVDDYLWVMLMRDSSLSNR